MNNKKGFTLLEILIVVVIAASVLLFAVPAYKRTQDKSVFTAAQGVLIELRSAVQSVRQDLAAGGSSVQLPSGTTPLQLLAAWQNESSVDYHDYMVSPNRDLFYGWQNAKMKTKLKMIKPVMSAVAEGVTAVGTMSGGR